MKIKRLNIGAFGKFRDVSLDFSDGVNLIYGQNESGKSTLAAFIKFVLFGLPRKRGNPPIEENERAKYMPWQGGQMFGSIEAECGGRLLLIERTAGKDSVCVKDALTGAKLDGFAAEPGEALLGVTLPIFERTMFTPQSGIDVTSSDELQTRIGNMVTSGDENISFEKALERLDSALTQLVHKRGGKGRIYELNEQIRELEDELKQAENANRRLVEIMQKQAELKEQIAGYEQKILMLREKIDKARAFEAKTQLERIEKIRQELSNAITDAGRAKAALCFEGITVDRQYCARLKSMSFELEKELEKLRFYEGNLARLKDELDKAALRAENARANAEKATAFIKSHEDFIKKNKKLKAAAFSMSVLFALLAIVFFALPFGFASVAFVIAAAFLLAFGIALSSAKGPASGDFADIEAAKAAVAKLEAEKSAADYSLAAFNQEDERYKAQKAVCEKLERELEFLARPCGIECDPRSIRGLAERLEAALYEYERLEDRAKVLKADYEKATESVDLAALEKAAENAQDGFGADIAALSEELEATRIEQRKALDQISSYEREAGGISCKNPSEVFEQLYQAQRRLKSCKLGYDSLSKAIEVLNEVYDEIQSVFAPALNEAAGRLLSDATGGKYDSVLVDQNFNVGVKCSGAIREIGYFSSGTRDAIYLALRTALLNLLIDEQIPVILDDAFSRFDDNRLELAFEHLIKMLSTRQIIIFTCHERERIVLERLKSSGRINMDYNYITINE